MLGQKGPAIKADMYAYLLKQGRVKGVTLFFLTLQRQIKAEISHRFTDEVCCNIYLLYTFIDVCVHMRIQASLRLQEHAFPRVLCFHGTF